MSFWSTNVILKWKFSLEIYCCIYLINIQMCPTKQSIHNLYVNILRRKTQWISWLNTAKFPEIIFRDVSFRSICSANMMPFLTQKYRIRFWRWVIPKDTLFYNLMYFISYTDGDLPLLRRFNPRNPARSM